MSTSTGQSIATVALWSVFGIQLGRALLSRRDEVFGGWRIWLVFFLGCVTFSLWGEHVDEELELTLGGLPLGVYLKFCTLILGAHLNVRIFGEVEPAALRHRSILLIAPVALTAATLLLVLTAVFRWQLTDYGRLGVVAVRDALLLVYFLSVFLPVTWDIHRREQNPTMVFRNAATVGFCIVYLFVATGNILVFILAAAESRYAGDVQRLFHPVMYLCALFFTIAYIPHEWIARVRLLSRITVAVRVRQLAHQVATLTQQPPLPPVFWLRFLRKPTLVEDQIYRDVMFILDYGLQIQAGDTGTKLGERLHRIIGCEYEYERLVEELARL